MLILGSQKQVLEGEGTLRKTSKSHNEIPNNVCIVNKRVSCH